MEQIPNCKCHDVPMFRYKNVRTGPKAQTHYWRCRVKYNEWQRTKKRKPGYESRRAVRLKKFGITEADYKLLFDEQGGLCAICRKPPDTRWKMLAIDHDHKTGKVRGLLCMTCNTMLGRLEARWAATMEYLGV